MKITLEEQLKKGRESVMTSVEKNLVKTNLVAFMSANPLPISLKKTPFERSIPSPFMSSFSLLPLFRISASALGVVLILGGSLTYASGTALPGNILYPVKVHVRETVARALAVKPEAKIAFDQERVKTRISELKTLQGQDNADITSIKEAEDAFSTSLDSFEKSLDEGENSGRVALVEEAQKDILEKLQTETIEATPALMKAVPMMATTSREVASEDSLSEKTLKKNPRIEKLLKRAHENVSKRAFLKERARILEATPQPKELDTLSPTPTDVKEVSATVPKAETPKAPKEPTRLSDNKEKEAELTTHQGE